MSNIEKYNQYFDRPLGVDRYQSGEKRYSRIPAYIVITAISGICKVLYRYDIHNRESLDALARTRGVVVVSNHSSYLDVVFMYLSMFPTYFPRFIARDTLFESSAFLRWVFAHIGAFPIKRDSADRQAIKRAVKMLRNNEIVALMPEGTRRGKGSVAPRIHGGAALIARMGKAPILPMAVRNVDKIKRKGERLRFPKISIYYGNPVMLSDFDFLPKQERLDACIWYTLRECYALFWDVTPEEVDMPALFPEDKDYTQTFVDHPIIRLSSDEVAALLAGDDE